MGHTRLKKDKCLQTRVLGRIYPHGGEALDDVM